MFKKLIVFSLVISSSLYSWEEPAVRAQGWGKAVPVALADVQPSVRRAVHARPEHTYRANRSVNAARAMHAQPGTYRIGRPAYAAVPAARAENLFRPIIRPQGWKSNR